MTGYLSGFLEFLVSKLIDSMPTKMALAQHALGPSFALGELCKQRNIPAMLLSHSTHVRHKKGTAAQEWKFHADTLINSEFEYVASQSSLTMDFLTSQSNLSSKIIDTGPMIFASPNETVVDRMQARLRLFPQHHQKSIILHAGTPKSLSSLRPLVYETVDEYIRNINHLIMEIQNRNDVFLAIRFRAAEYLTLSDFRKLLLPSSNLGVFTEGSLDDYLASTDLLVSYSSTVIEEALQYRLPIILYDADGKYAH